MAAAFALLAAAACSDSSTKGGDHNSPAAIAVTGGNQQVGAAGAALGTPVAVRVTNSQGNPLAGQTVTFAVARGGGSVASPSVTTDNSGIAQTTWTLGSGAVRQLLKASVGSTSGLATATVDTTRALYLMAERDTVSVGDTIWVDVISGTSALNGEVRGAVQETIGNSIPVAAHLAIVYYTRGELIDDTGNSGLLNVITSAPNNASARQQYLRLGYTTTSSGKDVQFSHSASAFFGARTFNDLLSQVSVVGTFVHIR